jgi:hypothetical protein
MFVPFLFCPFGQNAWLFVLYCKAEEQSRQYCYVQMWEGLKGLKLDCRSLSKADKNSWIRPVIKDYKSLKPLSFVRMQVQVQVGEPFE